MKKIELSICRFDKIFPWGVLNELMDFEFLIILDILMICKVLVKREK